MSRSRDPLAEPKAIGEDVEALVIDAVDGLQAAGNAEAFYDAVATDVIGPRTAPTVSFGGIPLVDADTLVEIKACKRHVSNGARGNRPGRWLIPVDQLDAMVSESGVFLLAVYEEHEDAKRLVEMVIVPATLLEEHLRDSWYEVDRHEQEVAQLPWPELVGRG
ncbi:hypothetical protein [Salinibaculum marinum]